MQNVAEIGRLNNCDGCNQPMDWTQYQNHECVAYKRHKFKNPFEHKASLAVWKTPKGKVVARGTCLTQEDIAMVRQKIENDVQGSGIRSYLNTSTKRGKRTTSVLVVMALIAIAIYAAQSGNG